MTCWQKQGYAKDAPFQPWDEPCEHLRAIGPDIRRKLKGNVQVADEATAKKEGVKGEWEGKLF